MIMDRLYEAAKVSPVCVGLDTKPGFLPGCLTAKDWSMGEKIAEFNRRVVREALVNGLIRPAFHAARREARA